MRRSPRPAAASPRPSRRHEGGVGRPSCSNSAAAASHALMRGGCTTVEIKSGYGLDTAERAAPARRSPRRSATSEAVRIVPTLLALHAFPPDQRDRRAHYVGEIVDKLIPAVAQGRAGDQRRRLLRDHRLHPARGRARCSRPRAHHGLRVRLHAEQLSQPERRRARRHIARCRPTISSISTRPAPRRWPRPAPSRCCCPAPSTRCRKRRSRRSSCCASTSVPIAIATDCNPGTSPLLSPTLAMNMACTLFGLTPEEALAGMTINAARALGLAHEVGSIAAGKAADLVRLARREPGRARLLDRPAGAGAADFRGARCLGSRAALIALVCWAGLRSNSAATYRPCGCSLDDAVDPRSLLHRSSPTSLVAIVDDGGRDRPRLSPFLSAALTLASCSSASST